MASWDPNRDYATEIQEAILAGKDPEYVKQLNDARNAKIAATEKWNDLAGDKYAQMAERYIQNSGVNASAGYQASVNANNLATQQAINNLEAQIPGINQTYDSLLRQNEINNRLEQENIRRGSIYGNYSSTGLPDTLKTAQSTAYQNLRNQNEQERQNALQSIENQKVNTQLTGDINAANMMADYYNNLANQAYQKELANQQREWDVEDRDYAANLNNNANNQNYAWNAILNGVYTPELAKAAGLDDATAKKIADSMRAAMTPTVVKTSSGGGGSAGRSSGSGSGGSSGKNNSTLTYSQAKALLDDGTYTPNALAAYEQATGQSYFTDKLSDEAWQIMELLENARDNNGNRHSISQLNQWINAYLDRGMLTETEADILKHLMKE